MTTADGMHPAFSGRHPKLFKMSDLYRLLTEIAEVNADIARCFLKSIIYHCYLKVISPVSGLKTQTICIDICFSETDICISNTYPYPADKKNRLFNASSA